jgi:hypothetical protein
LSPRKRAEGDVYFRLLEKLSLESEALNGRVFDILGAVFEGVSLKNLLLQAIRYGDQPEVRARLGQRVENAFDHDRLRDILDRNALAQETMSAERLFAVKDEMEKAEARRLQPYFVRSFFMKAFEALGGSVHPREAAQFEITHVPASIGSATASSRAATAASSHRCSSVTSASVLHEKPYAHLTSRGFRLPPCFILAIRLCSR